MNYKPSIPKGTRDFSPEVVYKRNFIFDTIRDVYTLYGYQPLETPAMENLSTLTGKYGIEGDKLLFKVLNSGDFFEGVSEDVKSNLSSRTLTPHIADKGLRYDLTVPFARYVVQHRNEIQLPFKRYQIQPVWRADRPQKGRYREFYQCDADVVGSNSLTNELEMVQMIDEVFTKFGIEVQIRLNNRKVLSGLAEIIGLEDKFVEFTIAIDKIDKIGIDNVFSEVGALGANENGLLLLKRLFDDSHSFEELVSYLREALPESEEGCVGIEELEQLFKYIDVAQLRNHAVVDLSLARGLNYYTGTIIEVVAIDVQYGSLCGGGRYDDLTGIFGMPGLSGVGMSFGADRIFDVMSELNLFGASLPAGPTALFVNFGGEDELYSIKALRRLRGDGIAAEMYPDAAKIKKQMSYADVRKIPFVILAGENERVNGVYTIKDMIAGGQQTFDIDGLIGKLKRQ